MTVVSPRNFFLMTPMLAGSTVGTVEQRSIVEPIRSMLSRSGAAEATCVSPRPPALHTDRPRAWAQPPIPPAQGGTSLNAADV